MSSYIPQSREERAAMLAAIGISSADELFAAVPPPARVDRVELPDGRSELETRRFVEALESKNRRFSAIFRGAGAYNRYIPSVVGSVAGREEFLTAYTPYQAELSQGVLQSIFEFQTMICRLTGLDVANASLYDGASAAAEAVAMCRERKRTVALVSAAVNPMVMETVRTYCFGSGTPVVEIPSKDGVTDREALRELLEQYAESAACVYIQQPNYFGMIEDAERAGELAHAAGARFIMGVEPIAAAVLRSPGECCADIAVGEGQSLGLPMAFGGPYLGFMAVREKLMRRMPGRIVGQTTDAEGRRAFVLTLQAREQHIRREKAGSNICSNEALCALTAAVYMAAMGDEGMDRAARSSCGSAHFLAGELSKLGFAPRYSGEFFNEFVTECPMDTVRLMARLEEHGILGGLPLGDGGILWCCTELNDRAQLDALVAAIKEALNDETDL